MKRSNNTSRVNARRNVALEQVERRINEKKTDGMTADEHKKRINQAKKEKEILESRIKK